MIDVLPPDVVAAVDQALEELGAADPSPASRPTRRSPRSSSASSPAPAARSSRSRRRKAAPAAEPAPMSAERRAALEAELAELLGAVRNVDASIAMLQRERRRLVRQARELAEELGGRQIRIPFEEGQ